MTENRQHELEAMARRIIDSNRYMTVASVDEMGIPWATPVYFSPVEYRRLYWISSPETRHSRNIASTPEVSIAVFDSSVEIGHAEAVYMRARAEEVAAPTEEECARAFRPRFQGVMYFGPDELRHPATLRLYRATVDEHWVLIRGDDPIWGRGTDSRLAVSL